MYIEREGVRPRRSSIEALGEGRRIATVLGAPLLAFAPGWADDAAREVGFLLGRNGADRALLAPYRSLTDQPASWAPHGIALADVANRERALLVLAADTTAARDFMPRVAARLRAAFMPRTSIEHGPRGELVFTRPLYGAEYLRRLAADDIDRPVVATLCAGAYSHGRGDPDEVVETDVPEPRTPASSPTSTEVSPLDGELESAPVVVVGGGGVNERSWQLIQDLAGELGGEYGATRALVRSGVAPASREIGLSARHISPRLYIVCGASGSPEHLAAVGPDAEVIAINRDPAAPVFRRSTYGLVADLEQALPAMLDSVRRDMPKAVAP